MRTLARGYVYACMAIASIAAVAVMGYLVWSSVRNGDWLILAWLGVFVASLLFIQAVHFLGSENR
jgi:hypothetical protein